MMKKIIGLIIPMTFLAFVSLGQAAWIDPDPANVNAEIKLMVNVADPACECDLLIDDDIEGDSIYIWTWEPTENFSIPNGEWTASTLALKMTSEGDNIWSYTMVATEFYGVDPSVIYDGGISFLVKEYDGSAIDGAEPKSADFHVTVEPPGCVDKVCPFPQIFKEDDYLTIIYDNLLEENAGLQNIDPDDCYFLPVAVADGNDYPYTNNAFSQTIATEHPELNMFSEGNGKFASTILSENFFRNPDLSDNPVPEGVPIEAIKVRFRKSAFTGNISSYSELELQCED
jgi:hypothetical protein